MRVKDLSGLKYIIITIKATQYRTSWFRGGFLIYESQGLVRTMWFLQLKSLITVHPDPEAASLFRRVKD